MAVTILERPKGYQLSSTEVTAQLVATGPDTAVNSGSHGLVDGDVIYVISPIENYNGFVAVDKYTNDSFGLVSLSTGVFIPYIANTTIVYQAATLTHGWSCVHLPITYRLSTNLYPTNSSDTTRNINSVQDTNGWTVLQLSGSLGTVHTYDFVKITAPNDTELSKVYQILEWISDTVMIINLEYDSANNFTSATAIKHYNNYNIIVRVYAGINSAHQWTAQKPYVLAATLQFIPDDNNEAFFSINELLKSYIQTKNNLILGTLPNNIDFWTNFYIEVAESYDDSDGYVFGTTTSSYTSDQSTFEGTAVNAKLEFKNIQSGYLSEYLMTNNAAKFLTLFTIPVLFACGDDTPDCYSDISFLIPIDGIDVIFKQQYYANGNAGVSLSTNINGADQGVMRVELTPNCAYDRVDVSLQHNANISDLADYTNAASGSFPWTLGATPSVVLGVSEAANFLILPFTPVFGATYQVSYNITMAGGGVNQAFGITFLDASQLTVGLSGCSAVLVGGVNTGSCNITISVEDIAYIAVELVNLSGSDTYTLNSLSIDTPTISETKQFKIDCLCQKQELRMTWLNNLGGFDYWAFTGKKDDIVEIQEAMTTKKNILPTWPKSYGADADTIKKQTLRISNKSYMVRSQFLTQDEVDAISYIKSSILVQIINSRTDRRTVIVDTDSFIVRKDGDKTHEIAFNISFTDDIPVQTT